MLQGLDRFITSYSRQSEGPLVGQNMQLIIEVHRYQAHRALLKETQTVSSLQNTQLVMRDMQST
jgi:hypothetical protein